MNNDFCDFLLLVDKMRQYQKQYFKTRDKAILIASKKLEESVDKFIAESTSIHLDEGVELHRFLNAAGTPYSAIYVNSVEIYSCEREHEGKMLAHWKEMQTSHG